VLNTIILGVGVILAPLFLKFHGENDTIRMSKDIFFCFYAVFATVSLKKVTNIRLYYKVLLVAFLFVSFFNAFNIFYARSWFQVVMVQFATLLAFSAFSGYEVRLKSALLNFVAISGIIQSVIMIGIYYNLNPEAYVLSFFYENLEYSHKSLAPSAAGSLGHPNLSGAFASIAMGAILRRKWVYCLPVFLIALYLGNSAMPILTAIAVIFSYFYKKTKLDNLYPYIITMVIGSYFILNGFPEGFLSSQNRHHFWEIAISKTNMLFGNGLGSFPSVFSKIAFNGEYFMQAHSEWVELYYAYGLIGIGLVIAFFLPIIRNIKDKIIYAMMMGVFINCYGNFFFHIGALSFLGLIVMAMAYGENNVEIMER
jgi:hypothetical protein